MPPTTRLYRSCLLAGVALLSLVAIWTRRDVVAADEKADAASNVAEQNDRYIVQDDHDPNGIGKFYMGREIAHVMGFAAAGWLERPQREQEEGLTKLVAALKLQPGMVVADIGAGSGRISMMMAKKVGDKGKVLAVDVQEEMLTLMAKKLDERGVTNVEPVLGTPKSPRLKTNSVDLALMVDVYHEFDFPYEMLSEIVKSLKRDGRVVFVEYRREDPKVRGMIKLVHTMTEAQVKKEASLPEFGLKWKETIGVLPVQHIIVFERRSESKSPPSPSGDQSSTSSKQ
ncbi:MAG: methyltransferase domain-containing protein [Planctomycetaceae bacterium]